ncbi:ATPase, T2SS/T4P/T4SS family, partial [Acinetobacter baumannii]
GDQVFIVRRQNTEKIALQEARRILGKPAHYQLCTEQEFNSLLSTSYAGDTGESQQVAAGLEDHPDLLSLADQVPETEDLMDQEDDAPIVRLINALLSEAIRVGASDIHIEAFEKKLSVRLRVDGQLREIVQPRRELAPLLVSRIKVMAKLDIAEKRVPQDGRISLRLAGREVDVRVSTLPSSHGERVVMRLLDKQAGRLNMTHLGLMANDYERLTQLVHRPHGIILVTGPTGSGKTTTLYAALSDLNDNTRNILTAEDPIEYQLEGIGQTQVNTKVDMTFARALKAMLRQDPDVVMVGEIRDLETAEIAVQASLTGHLVLSTLHTNTAIGAVTRLKDMGIEPFLLSSSLIGVVAQRLVRTLCPHCMTWREADTFEKQVF